MADERLRLSSEYAGLLLSDRARDRATTRFILAFDLSCSMRFLSCFKRLRSHVYLRLFSQNQSINVDVLSLTPALNSSRGLP